MTRGRRPRLPTGKVLAGIAADLRDTGVDYETVMLARGIPKSTAWRWWSRGRDAVNKLAKAMEADRTAKPADLFDDWTRERPYVDFWDTCATAIGQGAIDWHRDLRAAESPQMVAAARAWLQARSPAWKGKESIAATMETIGEDGQPTTRTQVTVHRVFAGLYEDAESNDD